MYEDINLTAIDGETLLDMRLPPIKYCIDTLIPQGLVVLGGAPKTGKSWMALDIGVRVSAKINMWNMPTSGGTVLYLALEDTLQRMQQRLNTITDVAAKNLQIVTTVPTLANGFCDDIRKFVATHPDTVMVVVDTYHHIRDGSTTLSYSKDYDDAKQIKKLADELQITILVVHHLRKQFDNDPLNMISGTNGLAGAADALLVLTKENRTDKTATLHCDGRDIEQRKINLKFADCKWGLVSDSLVQPVKMLPPILEDLVWYMQQQLTYTGSNSKFVEQFNIATDNTIAAQRLKQQMNKHRFTLEDLGVCYESKRSNTSRWLEIKYLPPVVADGDARDASDEEEQLY